MKQTLKWIGIVLVSIVLLPLVVIFFIYKKAIGKREYDPKVLDNLEEAAQDYVKKNCAFIGCGLTLQIHPPS